MTHDFATPIPALPRDSFRLLIKLNERKPRLDQVLLENLRQQERNLQLRNLSRGGLKELFRTRKIKIKGQRALPSSGLAAGETYVDIYGYGEDVVSDPAASAVTPAPDAVQAAV